MLFDHKLNIVLENIKSYIDMNAWIVDQHCAQLYFIINHLGIMGLHRPFALFSMKKFSSKMLTNFLFSEIIAIIKFHQESILISFM